jgi:hypothetical protein
MSLKDNEGSTKDDEVTIGDSSGNIDRWNIMHVSRYF